MTVRARGRAASVAIFIAVFALAACGRTRRPPVVALEQGPGRAGVVEVRGLDSRAVRTLRRLPPEAGVWTSVLRVAVGPDGPPMAGRYVLEGRTLRFMPAFPLEPGRTYQARLDLGRLGDEGVSPVEARLTPAPAVGPAPRLLAIYPSGPGAPQNLLRLYLQFSAPMSSVSPGALILLDQDGRALEEPFLPLGYELWSPDRTRLTVLVDPGRVKRGVLPQPVLNAGERYTLVVGNDWRDAQGRPLATGASHRFKAGPPERRALDLGAWRVAPPQTGTRSPLRLTFDRPLDRALLSSALGVSTALGERLDGQVAVEAGEERWSFTPARPWTPQTYQVVAQPWLEDTAGNRPGRPFEREGGGSTATGGSFSLSFRPHP